MVKYIEYCHLGPLIAYCKVLQPVLYHINERRYGRKIYESLQKCNEVEAYENKKKVHTRSTLRSKFIRNVVHHSVLK